MKAIMTVLIVSYDGYSDMWHDFFTLFRANWNDCKYPVVLVNNKKEFSFDGVRVINAGSEAQWSDRTRIALKEIESEYICLLLEDYFISRPVNNNRIVTNLELMQNNNISYLKLDTFSKIGGKNYGDGSYLKIPKDLRYGVSLQPAIWNRTYLLNKLGNDSYNPWRFEVDRCNEEQNNFDDGSLCIFDSSKPLNICHMVVQGQLLPNAVKRISNMGYTLTTQRKLLSSLDYFIYWLKSITSNSKYISLYKYLASLLGIRTVSQQNNK